MIEILKTFLTHFTYVALVLILMATGFGVPIPEDVPWSFFQAFSATTRNPPLPQIDTDDDGVADAANPHIPNLYLMMVAGMVGVLAGDSIVFTIGRRGLAATTSWPNISAK